MAIVDKYKNKDDQARAYCDYNIQKFTYRLSHMEKHHRRGLSCEEAKQIQKWRELFTYMQTKF